MSEDKKLYNETPIKELEECYDRFGRDRLEDLSEVSKNLDAHEYENILKIIHRWKGCCGPFGYGKLLHYGLQIESYIASRSFTKIEDVVNDIKQYLISKKG